MTRLRKPWALACIVVGLLGIGLFLVGERYQLPIIPHNDFAKGLWFGTCLGSELLGGSYFLRFKGGPTT